MRSIEVLRAAWKDHCDAILHDYEQQKAAGTLELLKEDDVPYETVNASIVEAKDYYASPDDNTFATRLVEATEFVAMAIAMIPEGWPVFVQQVRDHQEMRAEKKKEKVNV